MKRTHNCGELRQTNVSKTVCLQGWCHSRRDHGGLIFIDLRDRYGLTQIVFDPEVDKQAHQTAESLRREDVISIEGEVQQRKPDMENPKLPTGQVEVFVNSIEIVNRAETPPLEVDDRMKINEDIRLKYRYLDLRRPQMQQHLLIRHKAAQAAREYFNGKDFLEIETPLLMKSTPEGARDYVVPSRVHPGNFYALPQSPQIYKQLLMIAGCDRYYQIARCLRDEDLRADRQPEHTQMDFEMSFVEREDVISLVTGLYRHIFKKVLDLELPKEFPVLTYDESMARYGTDKPDLRFGLELTDVTAIVKDSDFTVFSSVAKSGGVVKCLNPQKDLTRKEVDDLIAFCQTQGAKGMAWMRVTEKGLESNIVKFFSEDIQKKLIEATQAKPGSMLLFIADKPKQANEVSARLRNELGRRLALINDGEFKFCWVVDFPLFEWDEDANRWEPAHHMFSMPRKEDLEFLEKDPARVKADLFDVVLNGIELGSGSIRISQPEIQKRVMQVIGMSEKELAEKFGFLLEAYKYGAPSHGGMGLGFDRMVALMCGFNDIREVIAFPKTKSAESLMDGSPSPLDEKQLKELHIKLDVVKQDKADVHEKKDASGKEEKKGK